MRFVLLLLAVTAASALQFTGVSESGYEQDGYPGTWNQQPHNASILYFYQQGVNIIRLPFRWERAITNGQLGAPLTTNSGGYFATYLSSVAYALSLGLTVIIDMHNYARFPLVNSVSFNQGGNGYNLIIGKGSTAGYSDFQNVWKQIASLPLLNSNSKVWFGLMNEPTGYNLPSGSYSTASDSFLPGDAAQLSNSGIAGVRSAGANNLVLVSGTVWTGVHSFLDRTWYSPQTGVGSYQSNADALGSGIQDSGNNWAIEVHTYLDYNFGGSPSNPCQAYPSYFLPALTQWAQGQAVSFPAYGWNPPATCPNTVQAGCNQYPAVSGRNIRLFLGEFGFQNTQDCVNYGTTVLNYIKSQSVDNGGPWLGFAWWAGGPNWGAAGSYGYNVEPEWDPSTSNGWCNPDTQQCNQVNNPLTATVKQWWVGGVGNAGASSSTGSGSSGSGSGSTGSSSSSSSGSCTNPAAAAGAQCGNSAGYPLSQGSTAPSSFSCCPSGYSCQWNNNYWWQCNAVGSSSGSSTSGSSTSRSSTSVSSTSVSSTSGGSGGACIADWQQCGTNSPFDGSYASSASAGCCTQPGFQGTGVQKGCSQPGGTGYWQCKPQ